MHKLLTGHQCRTAQQCGWGGIKNGELLKQAESEFDLFITSDQNIRYQQNLAGRRISILWTPLSNKLRPHSKAAADLIQSTIAAIQPGKFRHLDIP